MAPNCRGGGTRIDVSLQGSRIITAEEGFSIVCGAAAPVEAPPGPKLKPSARPRMTKNGATAGFLLFFILASLKWLTHDPTLSQGHPDRQPHFLLEQEVGKEQLAQSSTAPGEGQTDSSKESSPPSLSLFFGVAQDGMGGKLAIYPPSFPWGLRPHGTGPRSVGHLTSQVGELRRRVYNPASPSTHAAISPQQG